MQIPSLVFPTRAQIAAPEQAALRVRIGLGAVLLVAALANFVNLSRNGYGNLYYAAAVKSMTQSWHNFFFVAFDPGGFVTVDKPPVALWIQAIFAKLFGFSGLSLLVPEAIAGVLAVALLFHLVRRLFGDVAGLLAALVLALSPVNVSVNRDNTVDAILVLSVLCAAWAASLATERGSWRWLLACAALVGLSFNVKMLEAYLVVPAFALMYLLGAPRPWRQRFGHLVLAGIMLLATTFLWVGIVDAVPTAQRPYVGSSTTNSEVALAFGYNGIQRLLGVFGRGGARPRGAVDPGAGFFAGETGTAGPLRLFNQALGSQASWLLPLVLIALLAIAWPLLERAGRAMLARVRHTDDERGGLHGLWHDFVALRMTPQQSAWLMWGVWLATCAAFFSVAGFFHAYYLSIMAPAVAALAAIGLLRLWSAYRAGGWPGWLLPSAIAVTALVQSRLIAPYSAQYPWLTPLVLVVGLGAALALAWVRLMNLPDVPEWAQRANTALTQRMPQLDVPRLPGSAIMGIVSLGFAALLFAPAIWTAATTNNIQGMLPAAGPSQIMTLNLDGETFRIQNRGFGGAENQQANAQLLAYLQAHRDGAKYLVATLNANSAAPLILATGAPVMAIGGFSGTDPILTAGDFAQLVKTNQVHYVLLQGAGRGGRRFGGFPGFGGFDGTSDEEGARSGFPGSGFPGFGGRTNGSAAVTTWIQKNCTVVPATTWGGSSASGIAGSRLGGSSQQLYS